MCSEVLENDMIIIPLTLKSLCVRLNDVLELASALSINDAQDKKKNEYVW